MLRSRTTIEETTPTRADEKMMRSVTGSIPPNIARRPRSARLTFDRGGECLFDGPAQTHSFYDAAWSYPEPFSPLCARQCLAAKCDTDIGDPIARLLFHRGPAAVARLVRLIVVDPFKRHARRWLSHIGKEVTRVVSPPLADCNSARAVAMERPARRIVATRHHGIPTAIAARLANSMGRVSGGCYGGRHVTEQASTRARIATFKVVHSNNDCRSATTFAPPPRPPISGVTICRLNDGQSLKTVPYEDSGKTWHELNISTNALYSKVF